MNQSGRRHRSIRWFAAGVGLMILCGIGQPALAFPPLPWSTQGHSELLPDRHTTLSTQVPSGRLREVEPPGGVQQLRQALSKHRPHLSLIRPLDGNQLMGGPLNLEFKIEDWPLSNDNDLGIGAHIAVQIDDQAPQRISEGDADHITIQLPDLNPGSHRFTAYAAYPWGEAVKTPGASLKGQLDQFKALQGTQPSRDSPWLAVVSPAELGADDPLLLDWLVWNAPLQNLKAGDARWRLRITINSDSFVVDQQDALWIQGIDNREGTKTVQMELLNEVGEAIDPVFNNQLRVVQQTQNIKPIWYQDHLDDTQMARLLGQAKQESPDIIQLPDSQDNTNTKGDKEVDDTEDGGLKEQASTNPKKERRALDEKSPNEGVFEEEILESEPFNPKTGVALDQGALDQETVPEESEDTEGKAIPTEAAPSALSLESIQPAEPEQQPTTDTSTMSLEPERVSPTSTLEGSARELFKADGTHH